MDLDLKGRAAIITAASRGLGKAAALALAREGANIAISSRTEQIFTVAEEIQVETGVDVVAYQTDLTAPTQIEAMVTKAHNHFKQLDILVINAGGPPPGGFLDFTPDDWSTAINLTLMSAVRLCYAVVPFMVAQGQGSIVATQSYSVKQPIDNLILSNSLRMAVIGLVKSLANELGPKGIRVNSINPAWTWTERVQQLMRDRAERDGTTVDEQAGKVTEDVPLGRMGTVEEFGKTIAWLASPAASFIHGHAIMFDGGATKASL